MAEQKTKDLKPRERWRVEIDSAKERQKDFWRAGGKVVSRYLDDRKSSETGASQGNAGDPEFRLNLFHANISTQLALLYGKVPETDVSRRWADPDDDISRVASEILQRLLNISIQAPGSTDTDILRACLEDRLLPGLGVARVRYTFEKEEVTERVQTVNSETGMAEIQEIPSTKIVDERSPLEYVHWRDLLWGYGRTWAEVPWVGFKTYLDKEAFIKRFGEEKVGKVNFNKKQPGNKEEEPDDPDKAAPWLQTEIIEIWDKPKREVVWFNSDCDELLDTKDDPLGLHGFFPLPAPMVSNVTTTLFLPKSDFSIAQDLYNQIDTLQTRISIITKAVKVVGLYDSSNKEIKRMLQEGTDNDLIPVDNWAMFAEKEGLKGQIDWLPLEDIVNALGKLQELRAETIQLLYEVTGMSDILRGHSEQYAGVGQEELKAKFASARVQHIQDDFARFASDLMRLRAEVIAKHYEPDSIYTQSNAQYMVEEFGLIEQAVEMIQRDELNWMWGIEIKPESIAMVDYAQIKTERIEFLTALGKFIQSSEAAVASNPAMAPFMLEMMKWGMAGFKGAQQIEGTLDKAVTKMEQQLKNPQPQQENPKVAEIKAKHQAEMEKMQKKAQDEMQKLLAEHKTNMMELAASNKYDLSVEQAQAFFNILEDQLNTQSKKELERIKQQAQDSGGSD